MKHIIFLISIVLISFSCQESETNYVMSSTDYVDNFDEEHPGKKLMETYCYVCHSPTQSHNERLAPPMIAVKQHYSVGEISKKEFVEQIQSWVGNPTEASARMYGAVRNFGVMPKTIYPGNTIELIADYMYEAEIEEPEWFQDHMKQNGKEKRQYQRIHKKNKS